jgi:hypothetical protein
MNHEPNEELFETIVRYVDGELDPAAEASFAERLLADAEARELLDEVRSADRLAGDAVRRVLAGGGAGRAAVGRRRGWLRVALPVAACLLVAAGVAWVLRGEPEDDASYVEKPQTPSAVVAATPAAPMQLDRSEALPPIDVPYNSQNRAETKFYRVFDQDDNEIYLMQVDRESALLEPIATDL